MPVRARSSVERFTIRWDAAMGCYRVSVPDLQGPVEVVSAALFDAQTQNYIEENNARAAAEAEVERLRTLILTAPSYLGARQPLHNEWLRQAEEAVGPSIYEDHDLPNAS